jgi:hypothetical protein
MEQWSSNSGCHKEDTWLFEQSANSVRVRQREFDLYFSSREDLDVTDNGEKFVTVTNLSYENAVFLFSSCFNVEEWENCPELLNNFSKIEMDLNSLTETINGRKDTKMHKQLEDIMKSNDKWFCRTSSASPKDNMGLDKAHGEQAMFFSDPHTLLYTIATSERCMKPTLAGFNKYLWLAPWYPLENFNSYRVFIRENKVRAISQYDMNDPPNNVEHLRQSIIDLWNRVQDDLWYTECTMDVVTNGEILKIVEFNEFGASCRAGSALYNWVQDMHLVYFGDADVRLNAQDPWDRKSV